MAGARAYLVLPTWPTLAATDVPQYSPALAVADLIFATGAANLFLSTYALSFAEFEFANDTAWRSSTACNLG